MDIVLRAVLIIVSVIATRELLVRIRKSRMQIEDSVFWVLLAFLCILLAVFPRILSDLWMWKFCRRTFWNRYFI